MEKREIYWGHIKITYSKDMNSFLVVPFVEKAIKSMQKHNIVGKVIEVDVSVGVNSKKWIAEATIKDDSGTLSYHKYMEM